MEEMKYNKQYIKYIFTIASLFSLAILFIFLNMCLSDEEDEIFSGLFGIDSSQKLLLGLGIVFIVYEAIALVFSICYWKNISYQINDEALTLNKGIIFKNKKVVPYNKMHAVTVERNIFMRLFKLSSLNIDSGNAANSFINEIEIVDTKEKIEKLEQDIKKNISLAKKGIKVSESNTEIENEVFHKEEIKHQEIKDCYNKKVRKELVFGSISIRIYSMILFGITLFSIVAFSIVDGFSLATLFIIIFVFFIVVSVITMFVDLGYYLKYYDFKLLYNESELVVSYGFFTQHRHTIARNRIKGIVLLQDVVQIKRGYATVAVEMVGLCNTETDDQFNNFIIPLQSIEKVKEIIKILDLNCEYKDVENNVANKSFIHFFSIPSIILSLIALPFIFAFISTTTAIIILIILLVIILFIVLLSIPTKKHQGITYDQKNLYLSNGCLTKRTVILPWTSIVSMGTISTPWRIKKGIVSIEVDFYSNKTNSQQKVLMVSQKTYAEVLLAFERLKNR